MFYNKLTVCNKAKGEGKWDGTQQFLTSGPGLKSPHMGGGEEDAERRGKKKLLETFVWLLLVFVVSVCIDGGNRSLRHMFSDASAGRWVKGVLNPAGPMRLFPHSGHQTWESVAASPLDCKRVWLHGRNPLPKCLFFLDLRGLKDAPLLSCHPFITELFHTVVNL